MALLYTRSLIIQWLIISLCVLGPACRFLTVSLFYDWHLSAAWYLEYMFSKHSRSENSLQLQLYLRHHTSSSTSPLPPNPHTPTTAVSFQDRSGKGSGLLHPSSRRHRYMLWVPSSQQPAAQLTHSCPFKQRDKAPKTAHTTPQRRFLTWTTNSLPPQQSPQGLHLTQFFPSRARRPSRVTRSGGLHASEARWRAIID